MSASAMRGPHFLRERVFPHNLHDPREMNRGKIDTLIIHNHGIGNILRLDPGERTSDIGGLVSLSLTVGPNVEVTKRGLALGLDFLQSSYRKA